MATRCSAPGRSADRRWCAGRAGAGLGAECLAFVDAELFWSDGARIGRGGELAAVTGDNGDELAALDGALLWCDSRRVLALDAALMPPERLGGAAPARQDAELQPAH